MVDGKGVNIDSLAVAGKRMMRAASRRLLPRLLASPGSSSLSTVASWDDASADVVVCGAGVVGVACAHYLARGGARVLLVDERPPLSYTSSLSTECYRNYWAGHVPMTEFMNRSIDLLEQHAAACGNAFSMNRRGYCFVSGTEEGAARHEAAVAAALELGAPAAIYTDGSHGMRYRGSELPFDSAGASSIEVFSGREAIAGFFGASPPGVLADGVTSVLYARRCGWMNAQQMGTHLLDGARSAGARTLIGASLIGMSTDKSGRVSGVTVRAPGDETRYLPCGAFVNAAGPFARHVNTMLADAASVHKSAAGTGPPPLSLDRWVRGHRAAAAEVYAEEFGELALDGPAALPLINEIHAKAILRDVHSAVPSTWPMMIWDDEVCIRMCSDRG